MHSSESQSKSWPAFRQIAVLLQRGAFTAAEVQNRLRQDPAEHPRTAAVHGAAARTGVWCSLLSERRAAELGRAANRLPSVILWYCQGVTLDDIGRRLSMFGGSSEAERAIAAASVLIAETLNRPELDAINPFAV